MKYPSMAVLCALPYMISPDNEYFLSFHHSSLNHTFDCHSQQIFLSLTSCPFISSLYICDHLYLLPYFLFLPPLHLITSFIPCSFTSILPHRYFFQFLISLFISVKKTHQMLAYILFQQHLTCNNAWPRCNRIL